ncbi:hypothetical protein AQS8620_02055 [Aquimixticola soesokkakensis]|uniref:50S ribosomal protein L35 n=1 Tax=Aquimixticola soesokkakensis TaxID=1519096 RepID=A0A1Y5SZQ3_9RHOB|nr:hypothetical protein [Aquimixticola soesokkakensis]SLN48758.1 hypothetical protein AQS8620_02055 [Aquimixticola soesokkakensis]
MQFDVYLVIGLILLVLSLPAIIGAISENRAPRAAAILLLAGGGLLVLALTGKPGGYTIEQIPQAFARVIGHYIL